MFKPKRNWNALHTILNIVLILILIFLILVFLDFINLKDFITLIECKSVIDDSKQILSLSNNNHNSIANVALRLFRSRSLSFKRHSRNLYNCIYELKRIDRINIFNNVLYNLLY
jgi:hypothetical protein